MNPVQFLKHQGNYYELEAALVKETIIIYLTYRKDNFSKVFKGIYTDQNLPGNVLKSYQNIWEVFQLFSSEINFKTQPYLGQLIVKTKNMDNQN